MTQNTKLLILGAFIVLAFISGSAIFYTSDEEVKTRYTEIIKEYETVIIESETELGEIKQELEDFLAGENPQN